MPYLIEKVKLPRELDRRIKVTESDKRDIDFLYRVERKSIREIARIYEDVCSRRTIQFVLFPEKYEESLKKHKLLMKRKRLVYYDKTKHANAIKKTRHYKQSLRKQGKI
jgi:hypothetical protein